MKNLLKKLTVSGLLIFSSTSAFATTYQCMFTTLQTSYTEPATFKWVQIDLNSWNPKKHGSPTVIGRCNKFLYNCRATDLENNQINCNSEKLGLLIQD